MPTIANHWGFPHSIPTRPAQTEITLYGFPVTIDEYRTSDLQAKVRVALWMEGEARRTRPLVEQRFDRDEFHNLVNESARKSLALYGNSVTENFLIEWYRDNRRTIQEAADRRSHNPMSFTDMGDASTATEQLKTRRRVGEDGRVYEELDIRGEDTDPVLLNALRDREHALIVEAERERLARLEIEERRQRERAELESIPGFGSF